MLQLVREAAGITEYLPPPLRSTLYARNTTCWIPKKRRRHVELALSARALDEPTSTAIYKFHPDFAGKVNVLVGELGYQQAQCQSTGSSLLCSKDAPFLCDIQSRVSESEFSKKLSGLPQSRLHF